MARNAEPQSVLIPWQADDNPSLFVLVNIYDTLLRTTKDGLGIEPGLATKWESTPDGLTWTFTIRDGLKFSDGTPVKGADFVTSLKQVSQSAKSVWKDSYKAIKDVQAPDDKTVKVILTQPHAPILSELAMFCAAILPAQMAMDSDKDGFDAYEDQGHRRVLAERLEEGRSDRPHPQPELLEGHTDRRYGHDRIRGGRQYAHPEVAGRRDGRHRLRAAQPDRDARAAAEHQDAILRHPAVLGDRHQCHAASRSTT